MEALLQLTEDHLQETEDHLQETEDHLQQAEDRLQETEDRLQAAKPHKIRKNQNKHINYYDLKQDDRGKQTGA